jgi:hypothetical protein
MGIATGFCVAGFGEERRARALDAERKNAREVMRGLGPIRVIVEELKQWISESAITEDMVRTTVELRLRRNGVPVVDDDSASILDVQMTGVREERSSMSAIYVSLSLVEWVVLDRDRLRTVAAQTWEHGGLDLSVGKDPDTRNLLEKLVDEFSNHYLAANAGSETRPTP